MSFHIKDNFSNTGDEDNEIEAPDRSQNPKLPKVNAVKKTQDDNSCGCGDKEHKSPADAQQPQGSKSR